MYESSSERWSPVQSVEKILLSVMSMLAGINIIFIYHLEPNDESGANIEASVFYFICNFIIIICRNCGEPIEKNLI